MPSVILGTPAASGVQQVISGNIWSGQGIHPQGGIQFRLDRSASGNCYIGLSGAMTVTSGQMLLSGGAASGMLDGMILGPGDGYWLPRLILNTSGNINVFAACDQACSGQARLYFEVF